MKELLRQFKKDQRGITLVALVVTIIILIILAGVAIGTLGDNGLFEKAKIAKQKQTEAEVKEKINLIVTEYIIEREQGKSLSQFLTEKKDNGEIDDFVDNNNGTFDIIINGYTTTINENDLSTTEPQILSDIMVTCLAKEFINNKIQALITVKSQSGEIKEIRLINNVTVQGNNKTTITFDHIIEANKEYQIEVELTNGTSSTKTIKYEDTEAPTAIIDIPTKVFFKNGKVTANIKLSDNRSGVNIESCKWVIVTNSENLGTENESLYTGGTFSSTEQSISSGNITEAGEYYIHLLLKDNLENVTEVISEKVEIKDAYAISTPEEFQAMGSELSGNYYVVNDIDMKNFDFVMINGTFTGTLNGQGHTISNLTIENTIAGSSEYNKAAIFKNIKGATIENIVLENVKVISANSHIGVLATEGTGLINIKKVGIEGIIYGEGGRVGSFIGDVDSTETQILFENCYARTKIGCGGKYDSGGFIGYKKDAIIKIENCYWSGSTNTTRRTGVFIGGYDSGRDNNSTIVHNAYYNSDLITFTISLQKIAGTPLTTEQFADSSNFTNWDFKENETDTEYTWYIEEDGYPELKF